MIKNKGIARKEDGEAPDRNLGLERTNITCKGTSVNSGRPV